MNLEQNSERNVGNSPNQSREPWILAVLMGAGVPIFLNVYWFSSFLDYVGYPPFPPKNSFCWLNESGLF